MCHLISEYCDKDEEVVKTRVRSSERERRQGGDGGAESRDVRRTRPVGETSTTAHSQPQEVGSY